MMTSAVETRSERMVFNLRFFMVGDYSRGGAKCHTFPMVRSSCITETKTPEGFPPAFEIISVTSFYFEDLAFNASTTIFSSAPAESIASASSDAVAEEDIIFTVV